MGSNGAACHESLTVRCEAARDVVEAAIETSRPLMEEAEHDFVVSMPPDRISLTGDASRLTQALSNVLINAACYTPNGGSVELSIATADEGVAISVADNGIGIQPAKLHDSFEIFAQADQIPDCAHEGLGIGLALTRRVLDLHGGRISVVSDGPGQGSVFTVYLPATLSVSAARPQDARVRPGNGTMPADSSRRVLVVDDYPDVIESMSLLLEIMNIDVRTASSGNEAIEVAETYRPDVILMDIGMPGMNGLECARAIRQ